jgi:hypothetical protein
MMKMKEHKFLYKDCLNIIKIGIKIENKNETGSERAVFLQLIFKGGKGLEK